MGSMVIPPWFQHEEPLARVLRKLDEVMGRVSEPEAIWLLTERDGLEPGCYVRQADGSYERRGGC